MTFCSFLKQSKFKWKLYYLHEQNAGVFLAPSLLLCAWSNTVDISAE